MTREIFTGNILTKFMALVMAVALWLYAINRQTEDLTEVVKLNISVPEGITVIEQSTEEITIQLRGPQSIIENIEGLIKDRKFQAQYVVKESPEGIEDQVKQTIPITRAHLSLPGTIKLMSVYPDRVDILLGKLQKKKLKVNLQKRGEPAIGYLVANEFIFPREVEVWGPLNTLKEVSFVNTVPVDIGGIAVEQNRTFPWRIGIEQKVFVKRGDKNVPVPVTCNEDVRVWMQITEQQETRLFEKTKIKVMRPVEYPYEIKLQDEFANVTVKGPKLVVDKLATEDIVLYIDVSSLKPPGPYKQPVKSDLPNNIELVEKLPEVHLDVREKRHLLEVK